MELTMKHARVSVFGLAMLLGMSLGSCATAPKPVAVTPATTPPAPAINPFADATLFVNPEYTKAVEGLIPAHAGEAAMLKKLSVIPTAIWLSWIADTKDVPRYLDLALQQQKAGGKPVITTFVVYDLPNRDCNAAASAGELPASPEGEARYQRDYIDAIAAGFAAHPDQRIAAILEPDSVGNLITNLGNPKCQAAEGIYKRGIAYAIAKLSLPNVFLYIDAAHSGWLGWPKNIVKTAPMFKEILAMAGGPDRIRGFATDVSNYNPAKDPTNPKRDPHAAPSDELGYVVDLNKALEAEGITGKGFIIDTSRGGKAYIRTSPGNWCNIKGAGLGERPQAAPAPLVDAYLWVKPPGESDGVADPKAERFDQNCASDDAAPGAPQAGKMFDSYVIDLLKNATPPL
jgi:cellulose 1,4-beta-cellobiosidase